MLIYESVIHCISILFEIILYFCFFALLDFSLQSAPSPSASSYPCMLPPSPSAPRSFETSYSSPHLPPPPSANTSTGESIPALHLLSVWQLKPCVFHHNIPTFTIWNTYNSPCLFIDLVICLLVVLNELFAKKINKNIWCKITHSQSIQDVDEFASLSEEIWRNVAIHHLLTNGSSAVNGCRQNEFKQLIKPSQ